MARFMSRVLGASGLEVQCTWEISLGEPVQCVYPDASLRKGILRIG